MRTTDAPQYDEPDNALVSRLLSRRRVLILSGAAGTVVLGGAGTAAGRNAANSSTLDSVKAAASASSTCMSLTTEQIEGPYYIDYELFRGNVVEDRTGIPLLLVLRAVDSTTCKPVRNSAVEIWHCDASGVYSGYTRNGNGGGGTAPGPMPSGPPPTDAPTPPPGGPGGAGGGHATPTDDLTWLRGIQMTDHEGFVVFRTVFPGWYAGRAVHIHTKVHTGGSRTSDGYTGGGTCHTGQFYFSEDSVKAAADSAPYSANTMTRTTLDQDFLYPGTGAQGGLLQLLYDTHHIERGVIGCITMAVDPDATNDGAGAPGGPDPVPTASPSPSVS
ncbi:intradiol ring-cleavage dioxygenase [Kitasatospora griseola]|uniref:intradiol ring-cleavage dioxygenase n=1 Tax=Kitasatospora griseola TaxID=2064 RepID=UPI00364C7E6D